MLLHNFFLNINAERKIGETRVDFCSLKINADRENGVNLSKSDLVSGLRESFEKTYHAMKRL